MPLLKSSIKANRQNQKRRQRNAHVRKTVKASYKSVIDNALGGNKEAALKEASAAFSEIDKAVKKNIIAKNNGSRKKSRIHRLLKQAGVVMPTFEKLVKKASKPNVAKAKAPKKEAKQEVKKEVKKVVKKSVKKTK